MGAILQATFCNSCCCMKIAAFWLKFHSKLLPRFHWIICRIASDNGFAPEATGLYLNQWWRSLPMHLCVTWPRWVRILILLCMHFIFNFIYCRYIWNLCFSTLFYFELMCRRHADIWSHSGHFPVHAPDPAWSLSDLYATRSWALVIWSIEVSVL